MQKLKVDIISNSGKINLDKEFGIQFSISENISIATAFITESSVSLIRKFLKSSVANKKSMQLIVGLYGGFNSKNVLKELLKTVKEYPDNFTVKISHNAIFHWKYYSFKSGSKVTNYIGSANFTESGLSNPGELSIKLSGNLKTREIRILKTEFDKIWRKDSIDILEFPLESYQSKKIKTFDSKGFKIENKLKVLLYKPKRKSIWKKSSINVCCYLVKVTQSASKQTLNSIFNTKSLWDKNNYCFIIAKNKDEFSNWQNSDYILEYSFIGTSKKLRLYEVKDATEIRTNDGKYFVAMKQVDGTGTKRLDSISTKRLLKSIGLNNSVNQRHIRLNEYKRKKIFEFFGVK